MFRVGDRVICIKKYSESYNLLPGMTGTILEIDYGLGDIGVRWDQDCGGHNLNRPKECKVGHGLWVLNEHIELIEESPIEIEDDIFELL